MPKVITLALLSLFLLHCAKNQSTQLSLSGVAAPTQEKDLGFLVEASSAQISALRSKHPEMKVRVLSSSLGFFEVNNVSESELRQVLPNQLVEKNAFFQTDTINSQSHKEFKALNQKGIFKGFKTSEDAAMALQTCRKSARAPTVDIEASFSPQEHTINFGELIDIKATGIANPDVGGTVRIIWDMAPPILSKNEITKGISDSQSFTPDTPGFYQIAIIAQGKDLSCNATILGVKVTDNPELSHSSSLTQTPEFSFFTHLAQTNAEEAWQHTKGTDVVVAVLDSGLNYNHPGIRDNLLIKDVELSSDGDTDNNDLANDFLGWDFVNGDNLPFDDEGHGSHVSGLVASPILGLAPEAKILPIKVLDAAGRTDFGTFLQGLAYAIDSQADVVNASLGVGPVHEVPEILRKIFQIANERNILIVTASGNGDQNGVAYDIGVDLALPASMQADNQIVVTATAQEKLTTYGNYSKLLVDIAAPGGDASEPVVSLTTTNGRNMAFMPSAGTSMAAPVTSGIAALVLSLNPELKPTEVKKLLVDTGKDLVTLREKTISGRQVNALKAVEQLLADINLK